MGYIQFDRVDVPEDNVVSLGLLNKQLERQRGSVEMGEIGAEMGVTCDEIDSKPVHTRLCATSASIAQMWESLLGFEHYSEVPNAGQPSLDEETCGLRFDTVPSVESFCTDADLAASASSTCSYSVVDDLDHVHQPGNGTRPPACLETQPSSFGDTPSAINTPAAAAAASTAMFQCAFCPSNFKVKGYLTRHMKKHLVTKDFRCPFWSVDCRCHASGEFSRKDTYKTHLKSIHFVYPVGVAKSQRSRSTGRCAACYQEFRNNNEWLTQHVESRSCSGLHK